MQIRYNYMEEKNGSVLTDFKGTRRIILIRERFIFFFFEIYIYTIYSLDETQIYHYTCSNGRHKRNQISPQGEFGQEFLVFFTGCVQSPPPPPPSPFPTGDNDGWPGIQGCLIKNLISNAVCSFPLGLFIALIDSGRN